MALTYLEIIGIREAVFDAAYGEDRKDIANLDSLLADEVYDVIFGDHLETIHAFPEVFVPCEEIKIIKEDERISILKFSKPRLLPLSYNKNAFKIPEGSDSHRTLRTLRTLDKAKSILNEKINTMFHRLNAYLERFEDMESLLTAWPLLKTLDLKTLEPISRGRNHPPKIY